MTAHPCPTCVPFTGEGAGSPSQALLLPPLTFLDLHCPLFRVSCFLLPGHVGDKGRSGRDARWPLAYSSQTHRHSRQM